MFVDMLVFAVLAYFYKYVEPAKDDTQFLNEEIALKEKTGATNAGFTDDQGK